MERKRISRRDFIKGMTAGAVGTVFPDTALAEEKAGVLAAWDEEADVVVIGFGGSGSIAALEATRKGASVIFLEKSEGRVGGNLALSSGTLHDSCGCDVDEWAHLYRHGTLRCGATEEEIHPVLEVASKANEWVSDYNLTFIWFDQETAGTTWPKHQIEGQASDMGPALWAEIDAEAQRLGVDVRTSTAAKRLIQNPKTKKILGVVAVNAQGNEKTFKARKGVIMACGGYEHNAEMFYHYNIPGVDLTPVAHAIPTNTGDGFPIADVRRVRTGDVRYGDAVDVRHREQSGSARQGLDRQGGHDRGAGR